MSEVETTVRKFDAPIECCIGFSSELVDFHLVGWCNDGELKIQCPYPSTAAEAREHIAGCLKDLKAVPRDNDAGLECYTEEANEAIELVINTLRTMPFMFDRYTEFNFGSDIQDEPNDGIPANMNRLLHFRYAFSQRDG